MSTFPGQLVLVDLAAVADGLEDVVSLQGQPAFAVGVPGGVGDHKMGVKLGVQLAGGVMTEGRRTEVARCLPMLVVPLPGLDGGEPFQFRQGSTSRTVMGFVKAPILHRDGHDRDGLLSRALEVKKANGVLCLSRGELARAIWVLIEPQSLKNRVFALDRLFFYSEKLGAFPDPPADDLLVFGVVVVGREVSTEVGTSVSDFLASEHSMQPSQRRGLRGRE